MKKFYQDYESSGLKFSLAWNFLIYVFKLFQHKFGLYLVHFLELNQYSDFFFCSFSPHWKFS